MNVISMDIGNHSWHKMPQKKQNSNILIGKYICTGCAMIAKRSSSNRYLTISSSISKKKWENCSGYNK